MVFDVRFLYSNPLVYLGASNYTFILNNINNAPSAFMFPCYVTTNGTTIVSYATVAQAAACAPNVTITYTETYVAFGGGFYAREIRLTGLNSAGVEVS